MRTIDSKWVFKVNTNQGTPIFKARLCARSFLQKEGIDYTETFSSVVRYDSLRVLLSYITQEDLEMMSFDVCSAFLYGELEEKIFMEIPDGVSESKKGDNMVCLLVKSLYGLKQAPRCWNKNFKCFLRKFNFIECEGDKCVFVGKFNEVKVYLALYVDDGLIACASLTILHLIIKEARNTQLLLVMLVTL